MRRSYARSFVASLVVAAIATACAPTAPEQDASRAPVAPRMTDAPARAYVPREPLAIAYAAETESVVVEGARREFLVSAPRSASTSRALPLVFVFHGGGGSAASMRAYADLESRARAPAIFVYPSADVAHVWADEWAVHWDATRDVAFFDAMLDAIAKTHRIANVYALGLSSGAYFVNQLACARSDKLAGIVAFEGGGPFGECDAKVSAMIVHDPHDPVVPASEGAASLAHWLAANACKSPAKSTDNVCILHECAPSARVLACHAEGGVHAIAPGMRERALAFMSL